MQSPAPGIAASATGRGAPQVATCTGVASEGGESYSGGYGGGQASAAAEPGGQQQYSYAGGQAQPYAGGGVAPLNSGDGLGESLGVGGSGFFSNLLAGNEVRGMRGGCMKAVGCFPWGEGAHDSAGGCLASRGT